HWTQRFYNETNVLVQVNAEFFNSLTYVITVDSACERFIFELLLDRRDFQIIKAPAWTNQSARHQKAAKLVRCEQSFCHNGISRHSSVGRMPHDRANNTVRVAATAEYVRAFPGMPGFRVGEHLVVEIMQHPHDAPLV